MGKALHLCTCLQSRVYGNIVLHGHACSMSTKKKKNLSISTCPSCLKFQVVPFLHLLGSFTSVSPAAPPTGSRGDVRGACLRPTYPADVRMWLKMEMISPQQPTVMSQRALIPHWHTFQVSDIPGDGHHFGFASQTWRGPTKRKPHAEHAVLHCLSVSCIWDHKSHGATSVDLQMDIIWDQLATSAFRFTF